jgi:hypothetical protein
MKRSLAVLSRLISLPPRAIAAHTAPSFRRPLSSPASWNPCSIREVTLPGKFTTSLGGELHDIKVKVRPDTSTNNRKAKQRRRAQLLSYASTSGAQTLPVPLLCRWRFTGTRRFQLPARFLYFHPLVTAHTSRATLTTPPRAGGKTL